MKVCTACGTKFTSPDWQCPICASKPAVIAGHLAFAPALAESSDGFKASHFAELATLEADSFWFRSRNRLIVWALQTYFPDANTFLEIGCGTGFVLAEIEQSFPSLSLAGSEIYVSGLNYASTRVKNAAFFQMDARSIPFDNEFDVVGAFDVLEHIDQDQEVLRQIHRAIKPGGGVILTVPQHPFLWSKVDDYACHKRRYTASDLQKMVEAAGFVVNRKTSFVSFLLPLMLASRMLKKAGREGRGEKAELEMSLLANKALESIMILEGCLIRAGLSFPVGGSLLLAATKK